MDESKERTEEPHYKFSLEGKPNIITRKTCFFSGVFLAVCILLYFTPSPVPDTYLFMEGRYDASNLASNTVFLDGEWEFILDSPDADTENAATYITWSKKHESGTYRLVLKGLDPLRDYWLDMPRLPESHVAYFNGEVFGSGDSTPLWNTSPVKRLEGVTGNDELTIKVHKSQDSYSHCIIPPKLGSYSDIFKQLMWQNTMDLGFVFIFMVMGAFLLFHALSRKDASLLFIFLYFWNIALSGLLISANPLIFQLFPKLSWDSFLRLSYIASYGPPILSLLWLATRHGYLPDHKLSVVFSVLFFDFTLFLVFMIPSHFFPIFNTSLHIITILVIAFMFGTACEYMLKERLWARKSFILIAIACTVVSLGILISTVLIANMFSVPFGLHIFNHLPFFMKDKIPLTLFLYIVIFIFLHTFEITYSLTLSPLIQARRMMDEANNALAKSVVLYNLSPREQQVAKFIMEGKSNSEIAKELFISANTVKAHTSHVYEKTGATHRSELYLKLLADVLPPSPPAHSPDAPDNPDETV
ncbi:LuxR C-terminal-related transcriptional regulator [Parasphaerochaeta coccoides]|uniref:Transcriptional regulator, LuxR family n=1 Tax=Parasphaerochaeta coccoides (strain ATCC BAA-1237 / DSM 17374 / SPN1) TaxID=760011 RepID=F4GKF7_PARC1|nr:LuxR C-terminal-related transcriptional regulator [Parasphaerochaeta coccoides]AEC02840.1 transcriptional regulator, LuxR family [Parasphaerochaeta coccoides DSM 17374]